MILPNESDVKTVYALAHIRERRVMHGNLAWHFLCSDEGVCHVEEEMKTFQFDLAGHRSELILFGVDLRRATGENGFLGRAREGEDDLIAPDHDNSTRAPSAPRLLTTCSYKYAWPLYGKQEAGKENG